MHISAMEASRSKPLDLEFQVNVRALMWVLETGSQPFARAASGLGNGASLALRSMLLTAKAPSVHLDAFWLGLL